MVIMPIHCQAEIFGFFGVLGFFFSENMNLITSKRLLLVHIAVSIEINKQVLPEVFNSEVFNSAQTEILILFPSTVKRDFFAAGCYSA